MGYVTPETKELSNTGDVIFLDEVTSLQAIVNQVKAKGVKIVIALGHSGYSKDLEIAKQVNTAFGMLNWNITQPNYLHTYEYLF